MGWFFVVILEWLEAAAAQAGQLELAGQICHLAQTFGMIGPCLPG